MSTNAESPFIDGILGASFAQTIMASMGEGLYTVDTNGMVTSLNPAGERFFGWTFEELKGKKMHLMTHYKHRDGSPFPAEECAGLKVLKEGKSLKHFEDVFIRKDGSFFDVIYSSSPLLENDRIIGLVVVFRDVSELKRTEAAAQHQAAVVESSADAIITKALDGTITSWNESASRIFGYTPEEAIGKPVTMLFPPDHINEEPQIIARIKKGERVEHYETVRMKKDGSMIPISLTVSPIKNSSGQIVGASKIVRDISAQKEYERKLLDQANELEQFAYVASHDLQEPLRKVAVYSQFLVSQYQGNPEAHKYVGYIGDAVKRMQRLIKDLLSYSRANKPEATRPVNLEEVVKGVINDLEIPIRETQANVTWDPLNDVQANAFQVHQLIQNLISNAIKFRGKETPHIHISSQRDNGHVVTKVKDNGIGIEPRFQDQIFRVFQRLHSGDQYPGTGIGLAICKKIVERNGGKIWVESSPGKGSTFFFSLPSSGKQAGGSPSEN